MTEVEFVDIQCPSCSGLIRLAIDERNLNCNICGAKYDLIGHLCPHCHTFHEKTASVCSNCGSPLSRVCPDCQHSNWSGNEICANCGHRIDIFVSLSTSTQHSTADRLNKQMNLATELKVKEKSSSEKRMAELVAIEEARQEELRQRFEKQKQQERQLLTIVIGSVLVFLLIILVIAVISAI